MEEGEDTGNNREAALLPLRLLDVAPSELFNGVRLIEAGKRYQEDQQNFAGRKGYTTLSYRWGQPKPLRTLHDTVQSFQDGIKWEALPKVFQEAIMVTRWINVRYIWIDSLCIVQDDPEELRHEMAKMGEIYQNSTLTIGATHSENTTQGLFLPRQTITSVALPTVYMTNATADGSTGLVYLRLPYLEAECSPDGGPLATRAWCFQEQLLSRRYLSFAKSCLVWQCRSIGQDETGLPQSLRRVYRRRGWWEWALIVEHYSKRAMTSLDDKLNALAGYVRSHGDAWNRGLYFNGVWHDHYPYYLLWYGVEILASGSKTLNLPSWTWASRTGAVSFLFLHREGGFELTYCMNGSSLIDNETISIENARILTGYSIEADTTPMDKCIPGEISRVNRDGIIHIQHTRAIGAPDSETPRYVQLLRNERPKLGGNQRYFCVNNTEEHLCGWAILDEASKPQEPVFFLPIFSEEKVGEAWSYFIIRGLVGCIISDNRRTNAFRRVGIMTMVLLEGIGDVPTQRITLI